MAELSMALSHKLVELVAGAEILAYREGKTTLSGT
jgi:hypothetical protein